MDTDEEDRIDQEEAAISGPRWGGEHDSIRPRSEIAQFKYEYRLV